MLIQTGDVPLSKIMQGIQQSFTQGYNSKYCRTGHVFQQRYKAILVDGDSYLLQLIKYIHYNPVEAWMEEINYKWSSHQDYIKINKESVVEVEYVIKMLGKDLRSGLKEYIRFMNLDQREFNINEFLFDKVKPHATIEEFKGLQTEVSRVAINLEDIIKYVCEKTSLTIEEITRKTKLKKIVTARKAIIVLSDKYNEITNRDLSKILNISSSVISRIKGEKIDTGTSELIDEVIGELMVSGETSNQLH
jgi:hypothetical protein